MLGPFTTLQTGVQDDEQKKKIELLLKQIETLEKMIELLIEQLNKQPQSGAAVEQLQAQAATLEQAVAIGLLTPVG